MDIGKLTLRAMRGMLDRKEISAPELTSEYIKEAKASGHFVTVCADEAKAAADRAQKIINAGRATPLCGIPVALTDNICTEGIRTACGSKTLENFTPPYSAHVADRLNSENAVITGKTAIEEFGMHGSAHVSVFTADCGAVTLRPTYGRVSRFGLAAFASSFDQIGTVAGNAHDCGLLLNSIAGFDPQDVTTNKKSTPDFTAKAGQTAKGLKIALPKEFLEDCPDKGLINAVKEAAEWFTAQGAEVEEYSLPTVKYAYAAHRIISSAEASSNMARYDGIKFGHRSKEDGSFAELVRASRAEGFGFELKKRILLGNFALSNNNIQDYFFKAMAVRQKLREEYTALFERFNLILCGGCNIPSILAGLPVISTSGISVTGNYWDEETIIQAADFFERGQES
ncbi:MAG: amidase family protein [Oscillospiraceae bacterium]|nr:amidase family protein [Oscillospiraceae bacterium]